MNRRRTREVTIGGVVIGGDRPIAIQSMTTADTNDVDKSVRQVAELARAGSEIVRLTVPSIKAADSLRAIRERLRAEGIDVPLVADVHYTPNAALASAEFVEKVRINPGNYADRPGRTGGESSFEEGRARVEERFGPLVRKLKEKDRALRIGVNHGSLSERITSRYGDNPEGMVESALEYIAVCERLGFRNVVVSLKSSIPAVTVAANRLFAEKVDREGGGRYPLHLGVTEAGAGEEGRVRSASGIGALLLEGIGDTIRVSLTENPVREIPAAREILEIGGRLRDERDDREARSDAAPFSREIGRVAVGSVPVGGGAPLAILASGVGETGGEGADILYAASPEETERLAGDGRPVVLGAVDLAEALARCRNRPDGLLFTFPGERGNRWEETDRLIARSGAIPFPVLQAESRESVAPMLGELLEELPRSLAGGAVIAASYGPPADLAPALEAALGERRLDWPQFFLQAGDRALLEETIALSPPLLDGLGQLLFVRGEGGGPVAREILQGTRRRITRVEYISCPSCGRTLFDLEDVTGRIRNKTSHLKDIRIAVMGCIVNGPGEMADADFGYVGSGPGLIDLYVGQERVEKSIPEGEAVDRLVALIRSRGKWIDS